MSISIASTIKVFALDQYAALFDTRAVTLKLVPLPPDAEHAVSARELAPTASEDTLVLTSHPSRDGEVSARTANPTAQQGPHGRRTALWRLSLNVSNVCNMACHYCYANQGTYYTRGILMDKETALNAVNYMSRRFPRIELVNFFGGEPTLNQPLIELVCEYFSFLHSRGVLERLPRFGLTTNGYVIDQRMLQLLRNYQFSVTTSLDGPQEIHDYLRIGKNGRGTYKAIVENIEALNDIGINPEFECTYTAEHYRRGMDVVALMDFFFDTFRCRTLHCPTVIAEPDAPWFIPLSTATRLYADAIRYSISNLACGVPKSISLATRLLNSLTAKAPIDHYCPAGDSTLTVNADGNVYACSMLMHGPSSCLGNVNKNEYGPDADATVNLVNDANKWKNPVCGECWARSLCFGCLGEDLVRYGCIVHRSTTSGKSTFCDSKRKLIETFLTSVADTLIQQSSEVAHGPDRSC